MNDSMHTCFHHTSQSSLTATWESSTTSHVTTRTILGSSPLVRCKTPRAMSIHCRQSARARAQKSWTAERSATRSPRTTQYQLPIEASRRRLKEAPISVGNLRIHVAPWPDAARGRCPPRVPCLARVSARTPAHACGTGDKSRNKTYHRHRTVSNATHLVLSCSKRANELCKYYLGYILTSNDNDDTCVTDKET